MLTALLTARAEKIDSITSSGARGAPSSLRINFITDIMDAVDLLPLLEELDDNVDDLEEALAPILNATVTATSKKLPVLDKAKFHVLVTYALESLIFCMLLSLLCC